TLVHSGGKPAGRLTLDIFTQGDSWEELRSNVRDAVRSFFFDGAVPQQIRLRLVRDEVLTSQ
ncbi:MAG: 2-phospho-L-lactate guanylyltransferase, partial [bacterium]|nr:2-phospho-L-lactate guanylyltransferase [bacterium]